MSQADFLLILLLMAFVAWANRRLPEQGVYLTTGLAGAAYLIGWNLLKWFWAVRWCDLQLSCPSPSAVWGALPLFLLLGIALTAYFVWRIRAVRLLSYLNNGGRDDSSATD